jgi:hypothetical protein
MYCTGFSGTLEQRWEWCTWTGSHLIREHLGTSGPEEGAVGEVEGQEHTALCTKKGGWGQSKAENFPSPARRWCHPTGRVYVTRTSPWKRRNGITSVGYSGWIALRWEQCSMSAESCGSLTRRDVRYWFMAQQKVTQQWKTSYYTM